MINRINLLLRAKNIPARTFAEEIGIQPSGMSHILSGRNNPSLDFVTKVLRRYPEISTDWLLFGQGEMLKSSEVRSTPITASPTLQPMPAEEQNHTTFVEADLFTTPDAPMEGESTMPDYNYEEEAEEPMEPPTEEIRPIIAAHKAPCGKRIARIVFFYDDHTFESWEQ